jgi:hypothetical protein
MPLWCNNVMVGKETMNMNIEWEKIAEIDNWLDIYVSSLYKMQPTAQHWARVAKISEELGEAVSEFILVTGQNPRKGYDGSAYDRMLKELADVAMTAILAIQHFTKDNDRTRAIIVTQIIAVHERMENYVHNHGVP